MQLTTTISRSEEQTSSTILKLNGGHSEISIPSTVAEVVKELQKMEIFGIEEKVKINSWAKNSLPLFSITEKKSEALEALIELTVKIVQPKFLIQTKEESQAALLEIDDKIQALMEKFLSKGKTVDAIIAAYQLKEIKVTKVAKQEPIPKTVGEKLTLLLKKLEGNPSFTDEEKNYFRIWKNTLPPQFFDTEGEEFISEVSSIALGDLIIHMLYPALLREKEETEKKTLHSMLKALKEILSSKLPKGRNPEEFLESYQKISLKVKIFPQKQHIAEACVSQARNQLCEDANAVQNKICKNSEKNKEELLNLNDSRRKIGNTANDKILALTNKIGPLIKKMNENETQMTSLADTLETCHHKFQKNTQDCQNMLKNL